MSPMFDLDPVVAEALQDIHKHVRGITDLFAKKNCVGWLWDCSFRYPKWISVTYKRIPSRVGKAVSINEGNPKIIVKSIHQITPGRIE